MSNRVNFTGANSYSKFRKNLDKLDKQYANFRAAIYLDKNLKNITFGEFVNNYNKNVIKYSLKDNKNFKYEKDYNRWSLMGLLHDFLAPNSANYYNKKYLSIVQDFTDYLYNLNCFDVMFLNINISRESLKMREIFNYNAAPNMLFTTNILRELTDSSNPKITIKEYCKLALDFEDINIEKNREDSLFNIMADETNKELYLLSELTIYENLKKYNYRFMFDLGVGLCPILEQSLKESINENNITSIKNAILNNGDFYETILYNCVKSLTLNEAFVEDIYRNNTEMPVEWRVALESDKFKEDFKKQFKKVFDERLILE